MIVGQQNRRQLQPAHPLVPSTDGIQRLHALISVAFVVVAIVYLLQIGSPLRLVNDGIDYLLQASSAADGGGFQIHGVHSMRPPGYPFLILLLDKIGLGTSLAIVALNCLALAVGSWATYGALRISFGFSRETSRMLTLLTPMSFVMVRNVTYPLSDICFFGAAMPCILLLLRAERHTARDRFRRIALVLPLLLFCIELRTIGITLIPALLWAAIGGVDGGRKIYALLARHRVVTFVVLLVVVVTAGKIFLDSQYMRFNLPTFQHRGVLRSIVANIRDHTLEWGEMTANVPASRLPGPLQLPLRIAGALVIVACAAGVWSRRKSVDSVMLYVLGSAAIVFAYPWFDSRLWLPIMPFLMGYVLLGLERFIPKKPLRLLEIAYCLIFCLGGALALGYSTRLTLAGDRFPELFGDGRLRPTYQYAFRGEKPSDPAALNEDALYLLRRYDWRLSRRKPRGEPSFYR